MKERFKKLFKVIFKLRYFILFAIILLSINAYAWFIYITRVDSSITAKVRSWNVMFQVHDNNVSNEVVFDVGEIFPGMVDYSDSASVVNNGESAGTLTFNIKRVKIFNDVYTSNDYTNDELVSMLANNYPFKIDVGLTNTSVSPGHTESFVLDVTWPYESGDDALDTYWGNIAYDYLQHSTTTTCISISVEVIVNQDNPN